MKLEIAHPLSQLEHQDYPVYHKLQTHLMGVLNFIRQIFNFIIKENTSPDINLLTL
jgi:hypothetical protein